MSEAGQASRRLIAAWLGVLLALTGFALLLVDAGPQFDWLRQPTDRPALELAAGMAGAGLVYLLVLPLIRRSEQATPFYQCTILIIVLFAGLGLRLTMIPSTPALEDDFYRYLWDGGVTANGLNPYVMAPASSREPSAPEAIQALGSQAGPLLDRINYPDLKTIYPPVAQMAFAVSHWIEPWSLHAWRIVCLIGECTTLALLLVLLGQLGRSPLWAALYWLNPLIIKELMNSAHMEAVVLPLVMATLVLLVARRPLLAVGMLGLAIGAKLWPAVLAPLVLRPLWSRPAHFAAALLVLAIMLIAWLVPPLLGGLDTQSGFVAYARYWQNNSAVFQSVQHVATWALAGLELPADAPGLLVRAGFAAIVAGLAMSLAWKQRAMTPGDTVTRAGWTVVALFLLSPAQFPWYAAWVLVFAPVLPLFSLLALTIFLPLYYISFHLAANGRYDTWIDVLLWVQWLPVLVLLVLDLVRAWRAPLRADLEIATSADLR